MIKISNIKKNYIENSKEYEVLHIKKLNIEQGEHVLFIGASGSGKTTLFNLISGIITPDEGILIINNKEITGLKESKRDLLRANTIGYIFQDFNLFNHLTVSQNIRLPMSFGDMKHDKTKRAISSYLIDQVDLCGKENQKVKSLSGGEKQRVAIARCLVNNPKVILADEPTGNLDYKNGANIMELLKRVAKNLKATLLVISHDTKQVDYFDKVINLEELNELNKV